MKISILVLSVVLSACASTTPPPSPQRDPIPMTYTNGPMPADSELTYVGELPPEPRKQTQPPAAREQTKKAEQLLEACAKSMSVYSGMAGIPKLGLEPTQMKCLASRLVTSCIGDLLWSKSQQRFIGSSEDERLLRTALDTSAEACRTLAENDQGLINGLHDLVFARWKSGK